MKVVVDRQLCDSNAVCVGIAPDVFKIDEDDVMQIIQEDVPTDREEELHLAVERCPKQALSIEES